MIFHVKDSKYCIGTEDCVEKDVDYPDDDKWMGITDTWTHCRQQCDGKQNCFVWTYVKSNNKCFTKGKSAIPRRRISNGHVSGLKVCEGMTD